MVPIKQCHHCYFISVSARRVCPECGHQFYPSRKALQAALDEMCDAFRDVAHQSAPKIKAYGEAKFLLGVR